MSSTGVRIARHETVEIHPEHNPLLRLLRRFLPLTDDYRDEQLFVRERRRRMATPLMAALVVVAAFDIVFAVDSIPAVSAITREPFLVFAANAFSLLGLRALYFLLAGSMQRFRYLSVGLGAILAFVGAKMLASDLYHVPVWASLGFIVLALAVTVLASLHVRPVPRLGRATGPATVPRPAPRA